MKKALITFFLALAALLPAQAQQLRVATGKAGDTYSSMLRQLGSTCSTGVALIEIASGGSNDNINQLVGNQVNAAFVQMDVLWLRARTEDLGNVKTLLAMHPEQVHILARANGGTKQGGVMGIGAKVVPFETIADLAGHRVGAAGGSKVTAEVMRLQSEIAYNVVPFDNGNDVLEALGKGQIEAAIFVGGAPLASIAKLGPEFKLLAIPAPVIEKLKGHPLFAHITLLRSERSPIAALVTEMLEEISPNALP